MTTAIRDRQHAGFEVVPAPAALGAEVRGLDLKRLDDATFKALHRAWLDNVLLIFRGQALVAEDVVNLVRRFGTPVTSSNLHRSGLAASDTRADIRATAVAERAGNALLNLPPEITVVSNLKQEGKPVGILGDGEVVWHADFSFKERPTAARMLIAMEVPPRELGGNTYFLNCYAAYDALPTGMKRRISGQTIKQADIVDTAMKVRAGMSLDMDFREVPGPSHPIISTHPETGHNLLFLGRRHGSYVNGYSLEESEALLNELWAHCTQPRFWYEHKWSVGDVVVWDNRATLHRREPFDSQTCRVLYAAQVEGHRPYEAPDALSLPPHPRAALAL
ncbi:MAG: TauD/TfdA dioxygenase family protein [Burkholderiales bacterium]